VSLIAEKPPVAPPPRNTRSRAWMGQGLSLVLHAVLLFFGGLLFFETVEYGVDAGEGSAPAAAGELSAEVQIEEEPVEKVKEAEPEPEPVPEPVITDNGEEFVPKIEPVQTPPPKIAAAKAVIDAKPLPIKPAAPAKPAGGGGNAAQDSSGAGGAQVPAKPNYLKNPPPPYPAEARKNKQEGLVVLLADVNAKGTVDNVVLKKSSGFPLLDESALKAVRGWKFLPATLGGIQIASSVQVPVRFRLEQ